MYLMTRLLSQQKISHSVLILVTLEAISPWIPARLWWPSWTMMVSMTVVWVLVTTMPTVYQIIEIDSIHWLVHAVEALHTVFSPEMCLRGAHSETEGDHTFSAVITCLSSGYKMPKGQRVHERSYIAKGTLVRPRGSYFRLVRPSCQWRCKIVEFRGGWSLGCTTPLQSWPVQRAIINSYPCEHKNNFHAWFPPIRNPFHSISSHFFTYLNFSLLENVVNTADC